MVSELEMACHMWTVYTKNAISFGTVEIHLNSSQITITTQNWNGPVTICEFKRFAEESEFFHYVKGYVEAKGGRTIIKWSG